MINHDCTTQSFRENLKKLRVVSNNSAAALDAAPLFLLLVNEKIFARLWRSVRITGGMLCNIAFVGIVST